MARMNKTKRIVQAVQRVTRRISPTSSEARKKPIHLQSRPFQKGGTFRKEIAKDIKFRRRTAGGILQTKKFVKREIGRQANK